MDTSELKPLFDYLDEKFSGIDERFDNIEKRLGNLENAVHALAKDVSKKFGVPLPN